MVFHTFGSGVWINICARLKITQFSIFTAVDLNAWADFLLVLKIECMSVHSLFLLLLLLSRRRRRRHRYVLPFYFVALSTCVFWFIGHSTKSHERQSWKGYGICSFSISSRNLIEMQFGEWFAFDSYFSSILFFFFFFFGIDNSFRQPLTDRFLLSKKYIESP